MPQEVSLQYLQLSGGSSPALISLLQTYLRVFQVYSAIIGDVCHVYNIVLLQLGQKPRLFTIMSIYSQKLKGNHPLLCLKNHLQTQLYLSITKSSSLHWYTCPFTPLGIIDPFSRQVQPAINKDSFSGGAIGQKYPHLTVVHLP